MSTTEYERLVDVRVSALLGREPGQIGKLMSRSRAIHLIRFGPFAVMWENGPLPSVVSEARLRYGFPAADPRNSL